MPLKFRKWTGAAVTAGAFAVFLFVALHKLTHASVWLDEAIEFWYSRIMTGPLPYESAASATSGMVERINSTFQPPLYNFLMFFWLQISTSQWWFRFFGVLAGLAGMIGLYRTVQRISGSVYASSAAVFVSAFVFQLDYYWQECAEYCLMLAAVFWALYFWICLLKAPSRKNIVGLTVLSVIAVYSQYGAVFPVCMMLVSSLIVILREKKKELTLTLVISWGCAFLIAAVPLILFFFLPQITQQHSGGFAADGVRFRGNPLSDFIRGIAATFKWCVSFFLPDAATIVLLVLFTAFAAYMFFRGSRFLKTVIACNALLWLVYYLALKLEVYAYGLFGTRYSLFYIPCWLVTAAAMLYEAAGLLKARKKQGKTGPVKGFAIVTACFCLLFCFVNWHFALRDNWEKEDNRTATETWIRENPEGKETVVYFGAAAGFAYYLRNLSAAPEEMEKSIHYMDWSLRNRTNEEYDAYFTSLFGDRWPEEVFFVSQHAGEDRDIMLQRFTERGYRTEELNDRFVVRLTLSD